jgi:hypothetical protein
MACRIEIRKTIDESIDKVLPYRFEELGKAGAEKKAKDLNDLWGPLARPVRASSDTFQVEIYNIDNAVEKEFEKQTQAEQSFSQDLNFFNGDQALYEQDKKDLENQDVILPVKVKPGVQELFDSNPELSKIGTKEQYSTYLDTIFPDSKVKDIVYHGANEPIEGDKFVVRQGATGNGIWFSGSKRYATDVMNRTPQPESLSGRKLRGEPTMYSVILNIKNPKHYKDASGAILAQSPERFLEGKIEEYRLHGNEQYNKDVDDGVLFHHPNSKKPENRDSADQVVVFEPEQIHILGSKQDIEGFKKYTETT